jgi:outer membrane protein assembly factor BamB
MKKALCYALIIIVTPLCGMAQPTIVSFTPTRNALNVLKTTNITVTFDSSIDQSTINKSTIKINGSLSGLHSATYNYNSSNQTLTITPIAPFKVGDVATTTLTRGIRSVAGAPLMQSYTWSFSMKSDPGASLKFLQNSTPGVGSSPVSVTTGDFNGDGYLDLATTNDVSYTVSILLNNGDGTFTQGSTANVGGYPYSIVSGDLNGDGTIDLAIANCVSNTVSILLNNGSGIFTQNSTPSVGDHPISVTAGDFNGDGFLDLAVANQISNTVSILLNNGDGTFTQNSTPNVGSTPSSITAGDFNGDGYLDLAVANNGSNSVSILLNNGDGTFTQSSTPSVGNEPYSITAGDFNGDGTLDLAVANSGSNTVSILLNNGDGTFTQSSTPNVGRVPWSITAGDFNGDGCLDLAVVNNYSDNVCILLNNGSGTFTQSIMPSVVSNPWSVIAGDFNDDGYLDLAVASYNSRNVSLLKNQPSKATVNFSSSQLLFGGVRNGESRGQYLTIYNDGIDSSLVISNIISSNAMFTINRTSLIIPASGSDSVEVTFAPAVGGVTYYDSLTIKSNDSKKPIVKVYCNAWIDRSIFTISVNGPIYAGLSILGDDAIYAIASGDAVYRMSADGNIFYTLQVGGDVRSSSSIAYDTTVYIASSDKNLYAFSKDGNAVWSALPLGGELSATPAVDSMANRLYIGVSNRNFVAVNRTTGLVSWSYFADSPIGNSAVITQDRKLIFATQKGTLYGFDLNNLGTPVSPTWQMSLPDTAPSSLALDDQGFVYVGTSAGRLLKVAMQTGQKPSVVWQAQTDSAITGSPVIDGNGILYVGSTDSKLYAVNIQTGNVKWTFSTKAAIQSTPAISNAGIIYFGNDAGEVFALDSNKTVQWYFNTGSGVSAPLLYYSSTLYLGTLGNQVIALSDTADSSLGDMSKPPQSKRISAAPAIPVWGTFQGNNQRTGSLGNGINGIRSSNSNVPKEYRLYQNYPNPFNPTTIITYDVPKSSRVELIVYDVLGREVATLVDEQKNAGEYKVTFDGSRVASGVYFYKLVASPVEPMTAGTYICVKKLVLMK